MGVDEPGHEREESLERNFEGCLGINPVPCNLVSKAALLLHKTKPVTSSLPSQIGYMYALIHILPSRTPRTTEGDTAQMAWNGLGIELGQPASCRRQFLTILALVLFLIVIICGGCSASGGEASPGKTKERGGEWAWTVHVIG